MIEHNKSIIERVSVQHIGNITNGEELYLSKTPLDTSDTNVREMLSRFFLTPFTTPEYYNFTFSNGDFTLNPLYAYCTNIFNDARAIHINAIDIAKHLYALSVHPQIKPGDLFVAHISNITVDNEQVDAVGIFKSETRQSFLKLDQNQNEFSILYDEGINIEKLDKGCLIFNTDKEKGYKVCIVDKSNKSIEAQYWKDNFLQLKPCSDEYHHTAAFMNITKDFVTKQLSEEFDVSKADKIDLLNRSVDYFKTHDNFNKNDFERTVLQDTGVIKSFRNFDSAYRQDKDLELPDNFDVSAMAVKKQTRIFKSVLKLDRNFHIYIHGNRELIEKGVDKDGRKYYKIYFNEEA